MIDRWMMYAVPNLFECYRSLLPSLLIPHQAEAVVVPLQAGRIHPQGHWQSRSFVRRIVCEEESDRVRKWESNVKTEERTTLTVPQVVE